VKNKS
jgi:hypothetical protein